MIAALINEELACRARGKDYRWGTVTKHLERQMQEIYEHAEFCKKHSEAKHHPFIDGQVVKYERKLALATNEGHRLMIYSMTKKPENYNARLRRNRKRYSALDDIAEGMFPPPPREARLTYSREKK